MNGLGGLSRRVGMGATASPEFRRLICKGESRRSECVPSAGHSHATDDIERLRLRAVARFLDVRDRPRDVNVHAAEVSLSEHFEVRGEEILQEKIMIIFFKN